MKDSRMWTQTFGKKQSSLGPSQKKKESPGGPWALFCTSSSTVSFPTCLSGEATAASMKDAIKRDYPPLCFQKSQAQNALSLVIPGLTLDKVFLFPNCGN